MLTELHIENIAIIDHLDLTFGPGLVVFTGETGAGKSIILESLNLLLGGKADPDSIRSEADLARVEGTFKLGSMERTGVHELLQREDLLDEQDFVSLSREIRREGRSVARINGHSISLALLKELGELLVDIHGQSEHLSLLNVHAHLGLLDRYASVDELLAGYRSQYTELTTIRSRLQELRRLQQDADRRSEMLAFQAGEIEAARLIPGEEESSRQERDRLANAESLTGFAEQALTALDEGSVDSPASSDLIGQAYQALIKLSQVDTSQAGLVQQSANLQENLAELVRALRNYLEGIEFNPQRLEQVSERLDLIHRMEKKYGGSIASAMTFAADARKQLETITSAAAQISELEATESRIMEDLAYRALELSQKRSQAAQQMSRSIETELGDLHMASARFAVDFQRKPDPNGLPLPDGSHTAFDRTGIDRVEFLVAPNPGEGLKPLVKTASGGETSRLMLALKNVLAQADQIPILIFDEIDQGIGGRVGGTVGEKLWSLGRAHQVFVITHLPQLAVFGDQHFQVQKVLHRDRTLTRVTHLSGEARTLELAQMLGALSEGTLRSAHDLLQGAQAAKSGQKSAAR